MKRTKQTKTKPLVSNLQSKLRRKSPILLAVISYWLGYINLLFSCENQMVSIRIASPLKQTKLKKLKLILKVKDMARTQF